MNLLTLKIYSEIWIPYLRLIEYIVYCEANQTPPTKLQQ